MWPELKFSIIFSFEPLCSGVTGRGVRGAECPPTLLTGKFFADLPGKLRQGKKGKWRGKEGKSKKEGGKLKMQGVNITK